MEKVYTVIRFALRGGGGRWVKGASFSTKPGAHRNAVTRVRYTDDLREAAPMSRSMAQDIAVQFHRHVVSVHRADTGELIPDATLEVQREAAARRRADAEVLAAFNQMLREAAEAVPGLLHALRTM